MKRILIVIGSFEIGGTTVSLYSLLSKLDPQKVRVDILPLEKTGNYIDRLPNCNILDENIWLSHKTYYSGFVTKYICLLLLIIRKLAEKIGIDLYKVYNYIGGKTIQSDSYDAVIGFDETLSHYISLLPAKKRINWIHCDYRRHTNGRDEHTYFRKIDKVVCVSNFAKGVFCEVYPEFYDRTVAIHNIINIEDISQKSKALIEDERFTADCYTIISCGRMDPVKQFHLIPEIAEKVKALTEKPFKWYIIGGGNDELMKTIQAAIDKRQLQDIVTLLGMKTNVYPYMVKSNLYICTSYSESYPLVVNEAKALRLPVICNNFPSSRESIDDGVNGFIASIELMPNLIAKQISNGLSINNYYSENASILNKVYNLF